MRKYLVTLHCWFGLTMAVFLFIAGLTGAVISWDHELDEWLNPALFHAASTGTPQAALDLANKLEQDNPKLMVSYLPLDIEPGHTLGVGVAARPDPSTGKAHELDFNQVALNPVNGKIQGQREWGAVSLSRENLLPFLYKLHYSMHIPDAWGIELGILFMGIIAIIWVFDNLIALWISFPNFKSWRKSFAFRWQQGGYKLNFDLHRSGGVWVWLLLLILAVTSVSMNLNFQVMRPVVETFSSLSPSPFASRAPQPEDQPLEPGISREKILEIASTEARKRGWSAPAGAVFYSPAFGLYGVGFFEAGNDHGDGGLGNPWLYFDGKDGSPAGSVIPGTGSAGDIFMQAQFPLHSGRILGLPGRIMISVMGAVVAMLSITGIVIWLRKRRSRSTAQKVKNA
ncbi:PepSY domain-containing protein [Methylobacillus arboreus]|uniref:PepSY-associated TM helix domain-containing protein n=1 Tax=Methylobacillus arboreus TaxID=755170 RepID=UPI001E3363E7|nr:PepSY-associated TM helix domain-containing protein [Methylobacillus arboreus]MCB5190749.1 PepSY domain-containing protein [Methylobacillus arboreus]